MRTDGLPILCSITLLAAVALVASYRPALGASHTSITEIPRSE
jgi:hypothetical protein